MLSERQEKILNHLIEEYIDSAEPISSSLLKKQAGLNVSPATIRNELQELTELGYVMQPHTSAGRVPTEKGYKVFSVWIRQEHPDTVEDFISRQINEAKARMQKEMEAIEKCLYTLEHGDFFEILKMLDLWNKRTGN